MLNKLRKMCDCNEMDDRSSCLNTILMFFYVFSSPSGKEIENLTVDRIWNLSDIRK